MGVHELTDEQWCLLDLLVKARAAGVAKVHRLEILNSSVLPAAVTMKLVWAALTIPAELLKIDDGHEFSITDAGVQVYNLRFGSAARAAKPSEVANAVICLPGPSHHSGEKN